MTERELERERGGGAGCPSSCNKTREANTINCNQGNNTKIPVQKTVLCVPV